MGSPGCPNSVKLSQVLTSLYELVSLALCQLGYAAYAKLSVIMKSGRVFVSLAPRVLNAIINRTWQPTLGGRRRPDRSWLRPLEAGVASLPTFEIIRPKIARAAPLRGTGALQVSFFLRSTYQSEGFLVGSVRGQRECVLETLGLSCCPVPHSDLEN